MVHKIENPQLPMQTPIYEGMPHHSAISIIGTVIQGPHGLLTLNLTTTHGEVALSVNIRFFGDRSIGMNHLKHGRWHHEHRCHNPLMVGQQFHMVIKNKHSSYEIMINGMHVGSYHHHVCHKTINGMNMNGDAIIREVHFEGFHHHNGGGTVFVQPPMPYPAQPPYPVQQVPPQTVVFTQPQVIYRSYP